MKEDEGYRGRERKQRERDYTERASEWEWKRARDWERERETEDRQTDRQTDRHIEWDRNGGGVISRNENRTNLTYHKWMVPVYWCLHSNLPVDFYIWYQNHCKWTLEIWNTQITQNNINLKLI